MQTKEPGYSRTYFINPSGISYYRGLLDFAEILQSFRDNDIDVFGLSEINLDVRKPKVRKQCEDLVSEWYGMSLFASSTSTLPSKTPYKPGGTCMGITNEICGRYQKSGSDPHGLGRWSCIQMYGKDGTSLVIITGYRVCDANLSTSGASTAFHQQWHLLRLAGDKNPNPRKQFIADLTAEIIKWQNEGADIILGEDFNERMGETQDGLAKLVTKCNLVDPHAINHGTEGEPLTYSRGSK
jgi:hypothetical protein